MKEKCSCGAKFEIRMASDATWTEAGLAQVLEAMKDWRESHRHEMLEAEAPEFEAPPFINEKFSSHERALDETFAADRVPMGFARA